MQSSLSSKLHAAHHHGWQWPLGRRTRTAAHGRTRGGRQGHPPHHRGGAAAGRGHAHALRLFQRQLAASASGGRGLDGPVAALPQPGNGAPGPQRRPPHRHRPPRPPARRARRRHCARRGGDGFGRRAASAHRRRLFGARRHSQRRRADRGAGGPHLRGLLAPCHGRGGFARRSICSSAPAASSASPTSSCGRAPMRNCISRSACGPTSARPISPRRWTISGGANAGSAACPFPPLRLNRISSPLEAAHAYPAD